MTSPISKLYNPFVARTLQSPLHGLLDASVMLITFTGHKTGRQHTVPVNYVQDGNEVWVVSFRDRTWWKNLRGGTLVTLHLRGHLVQGKAEVFADDEMVRQKLSAFLQKVPRYAAYMDVQFDPHGLPDRAAVARAAQSRVIVRVLLIGEQTL